MTDPRLRAFSTVKRRLERGRDALRETLAQQQREREAAAREVARQQDALTHAAAEAARIASRLDTLLDGQRAVRIDEMLSWQDTLAMAHAHRVQTLATLQRAEQAASTLDGQLGETRVAIMRHDKRIELCDERVVALHRAAAQRADDLQDEESEEAHVARLVARAGAARRAQDNRVGGAR